MSLLLALIVGVLVGPALGFTLQGKTSYIPIYAGLGVIGAVLGDALYLISSTDQNNLFTLGGFLSQLVGALLFVLLFCLLHRLVPKKIKENGVSPSENQQE